jgi:hypothetical protein
MINRPASYFALTLSLTLSLTTASALAVEGMWTPEQLPEIEEDLRRKGLAMDADRLADLDGFPMAAVISLGGCTASFVSPQGLVVTNHHCARGSVQYNSTEENNYLADGFLAGSLDEELPAAPGTRVYVTTRRADVTDRVLAGVNDDMTPRERYQAIEDAQKSLIAECEAPGGVRCRVAEFYGGASYTLIERMEIRDVRLVYAPADSIGKYGGDVDNWMWPRHTGDFAFYRAYVGPDGKPADKSEENVPFRPEHFLKVSKSGLEAGDFVMVAGYPGRTSRYARSAEVEHVFGWAYPNWIEVIGDWIATIEETAPEGSDARIKYEARLAGLNNAMKNFGGQLEGARRVGLAERKAEREQALEAWLEADRDRAGAVRDIAGLDALIAEMNSDSRQDFWYDRVTFPQLLSAAQQLYRWSREQEKPDAEREPGYQERDRRFIAQRLERIDRRFDPSVDRAVWLLFLEGYLEQPVNERVEAFDAALGLESMMDREALEDRLDSYYEATKMNDLDERLAWMDRPAADFEASDDPFIRLAVALFDHEMAEEEEQKSFDGRMARQRPAYMEALIAQSREQGRAVYPDANSSLRVTYGNVFGGSPRDGLLYEPFTRLSGITEKDTGEAPFDAPPRQLELIEAGDFGDYALASLGSVPVNFLSDLDSTGGNSGSPTLDAEGNLVGLLFDGTIESVNSDWDFDPRTTRSIHVDSRYMLWVMEKVDGADRLLREMELTASP